MNDDRDAGDALLKKLGARAREERDEPLPPGVRPFDETAVDRITAKLLASEAKPAASVIRPSRFMWVAAPLAAAAALALWVGARSGDDAIPLYELDVVRAKDLRAPSAPSAADVTLDPAGDFELVARPASPASEVGVRAVLVRDGAARPWAAPVEVSAEGSVRISGATQALFPETNGAYEIVLVIGKKSALPPPEDAVRFSASAPPSPLRSVRTRVRFVDAR